MEKLQLLTTPPEYGTTVNFYGTPVPPDGVLDAWCSIETDKNNFDTPSARDIEDIRLRGDDLVAYGDKV
jgi:hypothetical protein